MYGLVRCSGSQQEATLCNNKMLLLSFLEGAALVQRFVLALHQFSSLSRRSQLPMYFITACPSFFSLPHPLSKHGGEDRFPWKSVVMKTRGLARNSGCLDVLAFFCTLSLPHIFCQLISRSLSFTDVTFCFQYIIWRWFY